MKIIFKMTRKANQNKSQFAKKIKNQQNQKKEYYKTVVIGFILHDTLIKKKKKWKS